MDAAPLVSSTCQRVAEQGGQPPVAGLVLGSGLGGLVDGLEDARTLELATIDGWPAPAVAGHAGRLVTGSLGGRPVAMFQGRIHAYEGHGLAACALPARVLCALGARALVLTNAAGGIREDLQPGCLMVIEDHLNLLGGSPLEGRNDEAWGPRFPDQSAVYPENLRRLAADVAARQDTTLQAGVYAALRGPQYETPAEIRMLAALGADAVGMSTVPEAIAAAHMGTPVLGISLIANRAAGLGSGPLNHAEVLEAGRSASAALTTLLGSLVPALP